VQEKEVGGQRSEVEGKRSKVRSTNIDFQH
jgi:hypothetical protein